jgi:hypothetical protein
MTYKVLAESITMGRKNFRCGDMIIGSQYSEANLIELVANSAIELVVEPNVPEVASEPKKGSNKADKKDNV